MVLDLPISTAIMILNWVAPVMAIIRCWSFMRSSL